MKEKTWSLVDSFFDSYNLVDHHIKSYNDFVNNRIQKIIDISDPIELEDEDGHKIRLQTGKLRIEKPFTREADGSNREIFPTEARLRNLNYSAHMYLEMRLVRDDEEETPEYEEVYIGELPLMLKSNICHLHGLSEEDLLKREEDPQDPGGYFIVNGSERAVVTMEEIAPNKIILEQKPDEVEDRHAKAIVTSIRSGFRARITLEYKKPRKSGVFLRISFPYVPGEIPLVILLRALGLSTDEQIITKISDDFDFQMCIADDIQVSNDDLNFDQEEMAEMSKEEREDYMTLAAIRYIGNRVAKGMTEEYRIKRAEDVIDKYLLPHMGTEPENREAKAIYLAEMTEMLLQVIEGQRKPHDKDHYTNKRLRVSGDLMEDLFRVAFTSLTRDMSYQLERSLSRGKELSIKQAVRSDVLTENIKHAIATGNWVGGRAGVSQLLDRVSYMATLSHLRRVVSPLTRSQPHFEARDLHPTQFGKICPNETPEGPNCGLVKNLALMCKISEGFDKEDVENIIKTMDYLDEVGDSENKTKIYINGELIGNCYEPEEFTAEMRNKRRAGEISNEMNITYYEDNHEIYIFTDPGRARRPLILVEDGESKLTSGILERVEKGDIKWDELFELGILEYLDAEEEENSLIAMDEDHLTPEHTHLEIDPSTMLGICAGIIPFSDHNSSPRNTMEAGMTKQALGLYVSNYSFRTDTRAHLLHHPQVPMVKTRIIDATNYDKRPSGQNLVVALMSYEGYNMEDAMILNKSSLERGMGRSSFFRSYEASERRYPGGQVDKFEVPEKGVKGYRSEDAYEHLDPADGIVSPEKRVESGDVLIGKTSPPRFLEEIDEFGSVGEKRRESSVTVRHGEKGIVDAVLLSETVEGNKLTKIRVRECRQPQFGDKFASRHGQKGVVGLILSQDDIPFTEDGVVPDIIVNPHAIPSRMSVGQVLEMVAGKAGCLEGHRVDGTPFQTDITDEFDEDNDKEYGTVEDLIKDQLFKNGFETAGCESLYNGVTGERIEAEIFVGVAYYQKLHHMTTDKVYARSTGPVQVLTRQPTEGRAREGGLRFGEMERDCLIAHGASLSLLERLLYESDKYEAVVCNDCGMLAVKEKGTNETHCPICGDSETFPIEISYAYKLLLDELKSLCMFPKLVLGDKA